MTKKVLITGFEAFNGAAFNPTELWINWMKNEVKEDEFLRAEVLPVSFSKAFEKLREACEEFRPEVVIMTGLAQNRQALTVERIGINWADARIPDNDGNQPLSQKIYPEASDGLFSTVSLEAMKASALQEGVELKVSTSAGEYVCNDLLFKTLHHFNGSQTLATFIHLPHAENYDQIFKALKRIVREI